jgi:hypothetical protein
MLGLRKPSQRETTVDAKTLAGYEGGCFTQ